MPHSFTQRVLDFLTARPNVYVSAVELESVGGRQAWRTRISEARHILESRGEGTIKNRQRRMTRADGTCWVLSEYAFLPAEVPSGLKVEADGQLAANW
jgi:hypothetical protein